MSPPTEQPAHQRLPAALAAERQPQVETVRLMALIESLNVAVLLQDEQHRVVLANTAFVEMFALGVPPERLRGAAGGPGGVPLAALYADAEEVRQRTAAAMRHGRPLRGEEIPLVDGRVLERDYVPITLDGSTLGFLWVFRDVTAQAEIRRGLEERARMLSELSTLKTEFIGVVSHELRTPLTSISTFATLLEEEVAALSAADRAAMTLAIRRNADRMLNLVADLILLAKLESGELGLHETEIDVPALLRDAAARNGTGGNSPSAARNGTGGNSPGAARNGTGGDGPVAVRLDLRHGPRLTGDTDLLAQLFDTAVGVLVTASAPGTEIVVHAAPLADRWQVTVSAPAADAATAERLLATHLPHPDVADERRTGALAVMLARAIAGRHGGDLSLAVAEPGARLTIGLPFRR
ncbi:histidine kinase dimerization/phospho-acceptor domain-containing protein [Planosporangium sp. 12N6]|uniref:histidine kinase dimerization/phospho-acceptor domain-containing protein n=1 Tax=Planosporangium spinosum TaxID=3402278 RepID=UPI003CE9162F